MQQIRQAAIKALLYSDLFDYPLTALEIWKYAVSQKSFSYDFLVHELEGMKKIIQKNNNFYSLAGRKHIITLREEREKIGKEKLEKAQKISRILSVIPTIRFIGVSGSVAMKNANSNDDIDFFFITKKGTAWISRFCVLLLLQLLGVRRRWNATVVEDAICANMFLDEEALTFPKSRRNLYIAHEILQMKPLFVYKKTYDQFLHANAWVADFLPNWQKTMISTSSGSVIRDMMAHTLMIVEPFFRIMQLMYMKKKHTTEIITNSFIAFHPRDVSAYILREFERRYRSYDL